MTIIRELCILWKLRRNIEDRTISWWNGLLLKDIGVSSIEADELRRRGLVNASNGLFPQVYVSLTQEGLRRIQFRSYLISIIVIGTFVLTLLQFLHLGLK